MMEENKRTNWGLTIALILGTVVVFFPLYMAVIIAFKQPSEMTNDIAGALAFPSRWSLDNFKQAMEVTDFWHSLGNSLLITLATIGLSLLIHSIGPDAVRHRAVNGSCVHVEKSQFLGHAAGNTALPRPAGSVQRHRNIFLFF